MMILRRRNITVAVITLIAILLIFTYINYRFHVLASMKACFFDHRHKKPFKHHKTPGQQQNQVARKESAEDGEHHKYIKRQHRERIQKILLEFQEESLNKTQRTPLILPTFDNRTSSNSPLLIYFRLSKSGSSTMMTLISRLKKKNNFKVPGTKTFYHQYLNTKEEIATIKNWLRAPRHSLYDSHVAMLDFDLVTKQWPTYISILRDPVERQISYFYYVRTRRHLEFIKKLWKKWNKKFIWPSKKWRELTIEDALQDSSRSSDEQISTLQDGKQNENTIVSYFCGNDPICRVYNNKEAIRRAKINIQKRFSVVGILEDMPVTLEVLEAYIPKYFRNIRKVFHNDVVLQNTNKKSVDPDWKLEFKMRLSPEYEIYNFAKQRLYLQYQHIHEKDG